MASCEGESVLEEYGGNWRKDTVVPVFSITKLVAVVLVLSLIEQKCCRLEDAVVYHWKEFADYDRKKANITIGQVLSHTAGISTLPKNTKLGDLKSKSEIVQQLLQQPLEWVPGEQAGYHAWTFGFLVEALVESITEREFRKPFPEYLADTLKHLGIQDGEFWIGRAGEQATAKVTKIGMFPISEEDAPPRQPAEEPLPSLDFVNSPDWANTSNLSAGGFGTGPGTMKILQELVFPKRLLSQETADLFFRTCYTGTDKVFCRKKVVWGLSAFVQGDDWLEYVWPTEEESALWGGYGGSMVVLDQNAKLCALWLHNRLILNPMKSPALEHLKSVHKQIYSTK